jgi:hypothetical protein
MGSSVSTPYNTVLEKFPEVDDYTIYVYRKAYFLLRRAGSKDGSITINIIEIRPVSKSDTEPVDVYLDAKNKPYTDLADDIIGSVPNFSVFSYSNYTYLNYLYSTKSRSGKYYETLISTISKEINAAGIWLFDASRGGKCKNFSLSLQLFISSGPKKFQTYYETLGYSFDGNFDEKMRRIEFMEKMKNGEIYKIKEYMKEIEYCIDIAREKQLTEQLLYIYGILNIFEKHGDTNKNLIEYLNDLIKDNKCLEVSVILSSEYPLWIMNASIENKIIENFLYILSFLNETKNGVYVKTF